MRAMTAQPRFFSVLRIAGVVILAIALYHFLSDWEWLPGEDGWGTGRLMALLFWAAVCILLDLILRRIVPDQFRLNAIEAAFLVAGVSIMIWLA